MHNLWRLGSRAIGGMVQWCSVTAVHVVVVRAWDLASHDFVRAAVHGLLHMCVTACARIVRHRCVRVGWRLSGCIANSSVLA